MAVAGKCLVNPYSVSASLVAFVAATTRAEDDAQVVRQIGLDELLNMYKVGQALKRGGSYEDLYGEDLRPRQAKRSDGADMIVDEKALFEQYQRSKSAPYMRFGRR